ncbi:hypothetical protein ACFLQY_03220 [Verrucomicrobiota bacterium]
MKNQIELIQSSGKKAVLVVTGGGVGALDALLAHPGASRFVLEACIPYSYPALIDYVGEDVLQAVCDETAHGMAEAAYKRGRRLDPFEPIIGISCTAALQTLRQRKGEDKAFLCIKDQDRQLSKLIEVPTGTRTEQEEFLSKAIIEFVVEFLGVA